MTIRLMIVDDQAILREGLATIFALEDDIEVVVEAADGEQTVARALDTRPDVVLMDLRMPVLDGSEATALILAHHPATAILVLTTFSDDESIVDALRAGAKEYLTKDTGRAELVAAVRAVAAGQRIFAAEVGNVLVGALLNGPATSPGPLPVSLAALHQPFDGQITHQCHFPEAPGAGSRPGHCARSRLKYTPAITLDPMIGTIDEIVINCAHPQSLAAVWASVHDWEQITRQIGLAPGCWTPRSRHCEPWPVSEADQLFTGWHARLHPR